MLEPTYSRIARNYDDMCSEPSDLEEDKELFGLLREHLTGKVLDIGAGTGLLLDNIDIPIEDYFGIDQSAEMLVVLDKKHPERKIMATDFEGFVGLMGDFDTVVALYGVASYIRQDYLVKVKETLSENGKFFLMFYKPNYYPRFYGDEEKAELDANSNYAHIHRTFDHVYDWSHYVIATNFVIEEWEASKFK